MKVRNQLVRFTLVGVVNTGTYYGCYLFFLHRLPYVVSHVLAFGLSMTGSFFLNSWFTYRTRPTWRKFVLFPLTNAANFVISTAGVYLLVDVLRLSSRYAPLITAAAAVPITFMVSRMIMLRPDRAPGPALAETEGPAPGQGPGPGPAPSDGDARPAASSSA
ncbi:GtrA family protein [Streptomyces paludis]|uniref:GtrA family protein n=1 Tax=Streptomyces paludis TaxID=2282738 RepID=A0A345HSR4_9ACTN|nr:GtrA family protein [Streptomyces paludis]